MSRAVSRLGASVITIAFWVTMAAPSWANLGDCAQPLTSGPAPVATDCLFILQVAVGITACNDAPCVCAPKGTLPPSATDALLCLNLAIGQPVATNCPCSTSNECFNSDPPTCGGECASGGTCAPDPFDPTDGCECLNNCELGPAPTCGGSCADAEQPGSVCTVLTFEPVGSAAESVCLCLPPDVEFCADAAPQCMGVCPPGAYCQGDGADGCHCVVQPLQGLCAQASAPACGGTCATDFLCQDTGGTCSCVSFQGQNETCFEGRIPTCGGACAFGEQCGIDFLGDCKCFYPCELGTAPACGGTCEPGTDDVCTVVTLGVLGGSLDFCDCRSPQ